MSLRGKECAACRRAGHFCPAVVWGCSLRQYAGEDAARAIDEPLCLDCGNDVVCSAFRMSGKVREESDVRAEIAYSEMGMPELVFPGVSTEVVHRTPEELGLARTIADTPEHRRADREAGRRLAEGAESNRRRAALDNAPLRRIRGIDVRLPAASSMGAEMIDLLADEAERARASRTKPLRSATSSKRRAIVTNVIQQQGGGRANNRVPSKRYGMPAVSVVEMDEVPEPCRRDSGIAAPLYAQIADLKSGALKVAFETEGHAGYVLTKLRKIAKKEDATLLSSKSADGKTRWFWLERA